MIYRFTAYGHPNIIGTHKTTLEFTKEHELSLNGNCIIGVNVDFDLNGIKKFIKGQKNKKIAITIAAEFKKFRENIIGEINPSFSSEKEFVIRKTDFVSERTFAISSDKAAFDLNRGLIDFLKEKKNKITVIIENISQ